MVNLNAKFAEEFNEKTALAESRGALHPACGKPSHHHVWAQGMSHDDRPMMCGKVETTGPDGKKSERRRLISDEFPMIRQCTCGAIQAQHITVGWCPISDPEYFTKYTKPDKVLKGA